MKVLFVCRSNTGRSQFAAEFYNKLHPGMAGAAGTAVDLPGQKLKDRLHATPGIVAMKEVGIDTANNKRTQLTRDMMVKFDKVIVMSEPENTPDWLRDNPKTELWDDVEDAKLKPIERVREIRDEIKARVDDLDKRINDAT